MTNLYVNVSMGASGGTQPATGKLCSAFDASKFVQNPTQLAPYPPQAPDETQTTDGSGNALFTTLSTLKNYWISVADIDGLHWFLVYGTRVGNSSGTRFLMNYSLILRGNNTNIVAGGGGGGGAAGALTLISKQTISVAGSNFTFASIPASYSHLMLTGQLKGDFSSSTNGHFAVSFNGDFGNNYFSSGQYQNGGSLFALRYNTVAGIPLTLGPYLTAGNVTGFDALIPNYANATFQKTCTSKWVTAVTAGSDTTAGTWGGLWQATLAAITQIDITDIDNTGGFVVGSTVSLYGVA